jgi:hypothetical protein
VDLADLRLRHGEALRREDVPNLGGADPECESADGTVGRGVAVPARDRHPGLREAELGADHMDDPLTAAGHVEERQTELLHVSMHVNRHLFRQRIRVRTGLIERRHDVVERPEGSLGHPDLQLQLLEHLEGLRGRHLVDEVEADQELGLTGGQSPHRVRFPDLVEQRARHGRLLLPVREARRLRNGGR